MLDALGGRTKAIRLCCLAAAALFVTAAAAQEDTRKKVAVMNLRAVMDEAPAGLKGLSELIASELNRYEGLAIITSADIDSLLGLESQKQLLGCSDDSLSCLAEIGGALGVDYMVAGQVSKLGDTWLLSLALIDTNASQALHRITRRADSESALVNVAVEGSRDLAFKLLPQGAVPKEVRGAVGSGAARTVGLWSGVAVGAVGLGLYGSGWLTHASHDRSQDETNPAITFKQANGARLRSGIGLGMAIGGAVAAVGSLLVFEAEPEDPLAVHVAPLKDGAVAVVGFTW